MCLLGLRPSHARPGPLLDALVHGGGSAAVVLPVERLDPRTSIWCGPLSSLPPCNRQHPHTDPHVVTSAQAKALNRAERAPQAGAALQLAMLLDGCAVGVHALAVPRVQPPLVFRCAPTTCPYAPSTCTFAPCKGQCRSLGVVSPRSARTHPHPTPTHPHTHTPSTPTPTHTARRA